MVNKLTHIIISLTNNNKQEEMIGFLPYDVLPKIESNLLANDGFNETESSNLNNKLPSMCFDKARWIYIYICAVPYSNDFHISIFFSF
jgi:hypothetical protein